MELDHQDDKFAVPATTISEIPTPALILVSQEEGEEEEIRPDVDNRRVYCMVFASLMAIVLLLNNQLRRHKRLSVYLPEAGLVILVGMMASFLVETLILVDEEVVMIHDELRYNTTTRAPDAESSADNDEIPELKWATNLLSFNPDVFFMFLLPPILFNSGYQLKRELFYRHIGPIVLFAGLGTILSALTVATLLYAVQHLGWYWGGFAPSGLELLAFGSLIGATDTVSTLSILEAKKVTPRLFYVVFGESALNDAVALVLFKTFVDFLGQQQGQQLEFDSRKELIFRLYKDFAYQAIGSPLLGSLASIGTAKIFQYSNFRNSDNNTGNHQLDLTLYLVLIIYLPYMIAEYFELSGIVSIFFCGLAARQYTTPQLSMETNHNADTIFKTAAYLAETCIFLEMGLSVFALSSKFKCGFILWAFLASLLGRAASIYPISLVWNFALGQQRYIPVDKKDPNENTDDDDDDNNEEKSCIDYDDCLSHYQYQSSVVANGSSSSSSIETPPSRRPTGTITPPPSPTTQLSSTNNNNSSLTQQQPTYYKKSTRTTPSSRKDLEISSNMMHVLWFAGIRGAVAYACVREFPETGHNNNNKDEFIAATMAIILITTFVMGGLTPVVLSCLKVPVNVNEEEYLVEWRRRRQHKDGSLLANRHHDWNTSTRSSSSQLFRFPLVSPDPTTTPSAEAARTTFAPPPPPPTMASDSWSFQTPDEFSYQWGTTASEKVPLLMAGSDGGGISSPIYGYVSPVPLSPHHHRVISDLSNPFMDNDNHDLAVEELPWPAAKRFRLDSITEPETSASKSTNVGNPSSN